MKKQKHYKMYLAHIPLELWAKIEKELKNKPQLSDRRNSYNRIIVDSLNKRYQNTGSANQSEYGDVFERIEYGHLIEGKERKEIDKHIMDKHDIKPPKQKGNEKT